MRANKRMKLTKRGLERPSRWVYGLLRGWAETMPNHPPVRRASQLIRGVRWTRGDGAVLLVQRSLCSATARSLWCAQGAGRAAPASVGWRARGAGQGGVPRRRLPWMFKSARHAPCTPGAREWLHAPAQRCVGRRPEGGASEGWSRGLRWRALVPSNKRMKLTKRGLERP